MSLYLRDLMAYHFIVMKQDSFTAAFFVSIALTLRCFLLTSPQRENSHPDFSDVINSTPHTRNKVLGKKHRGALPWDILFLVPMPICSWPDCKKHTMYVTRRVLIPSPYLIQCPVPSEVVT